MSTTHIPASVAERLALLDAEERALSGRRRDLHDLIDSIYLDAPLSDEQVERLDRLEDQEQRLSAQRTKLHFEIDELRAQAGLPRWRDARDLDS